MENSKIGWTDHTFNPWQGCTKVSPGCKRCYAETLMDKRWGKVAWGPEGERIRTSESYWKKPLTWNRDGWLECDKCRWRGSAHETQFDKRGNFKRDGFICPSCATPITKTTRQRVFCASLADVFEDRDELILWRHDFFDIMKATPNLDWLLLTKRPENILPFIVGYHLSRSDYRYDFDNMWIGTSIENQETADKRIPYLLEIQAKVRFLSVEPMLEKIDLRTLDPVPDMEPMLRRDRIDWVICGGESGLGCRPMELEWACDLQAQCFRTGIPFFMKQLGGHPDKHEKIADFPDDLRIQEFPK